MPIGENFHGKDFLLRILDKQPNALTDNERDILRARMYYLTKEEKERFGIGEEEKEDSAPKKKKK